MIPRYQTIIFAGVAIWLRWPWAEYSGTCANAPTSGWSPAKIRRPRGLREVAPAEQATLLVANDADGSLLAQIQSLPLPADPGARARAVLGKLLDLYAAPGATHPGPGRGQLGRPGVSDAGAGCRCGCIGTAHPPIRVRLMGEPVGKPIRRLRCWPSSTSPAASPPAIRRALKPRSLTVLSICGTLHANLPRVTEVRFLVDGQQRATLAGHADLTRTYLAADAAPTEGTQP